MQYREYGNTGKMISALGFGAMRLPKDEDYAVEVMQRYLDLGGNLIDTARAYGNSEKLPTAIARSWSARLSRGGAIRSTFPPRIMPLSVAGPTLRCGNRIWKKASRLWEWTI